MLSFVKARATRVRRLRGLEREIELSWSKVSLSFSPFLSSFFFLFFFSFSVSFFLSFRPIVYLRLVFSASAIPSADSIIASSCNHPANPWHTGRLLSRRVTRSCHVFIKKETFADEIATTRLPFLLLIIISHFRCARCFFLCRHQQSNPRSHVPY